MDDETATCSTCALCAGTLIGFVVAVAPFVWAGMAIYLGYGRLRDCPANDDIPVWCYGFGATLAVMIWVTSTNEAKRRALVRSGALDARAVIRTPVQNMVQVFQLCWTIYGSIIVFGCDDCKMAHVPGNGTSPGDNDAPGGDEGVGCDQLLFEFSYVSLILCWTIAPAVICVACTAAACCGDGRARDGSREARQQASAAAGVEVDVPPKYAETDPLLESAGGRRPERSSSPPPPIDFDEPRTPPPPIDRHDYE